MFSAGPKLIHDTSLTPPVYGLRNSTMLPRREQQTANTEITALSPRLFRVNKVISAALISGQSRMNQVHV